MGGAYWLALAAAQAVLDGIGDAPDVRLLQDQAFMADQTERWRVRVGEVSRQRRVAQELAAIEAPVRIDAPLVVCEGGELFFGEILELGNADAVLAGDHAI